MYRCESWTIKKAEHQRTDAFELCCWRGLLRVPWTARRFIWSILKEISPGCSLEVLMLRLKLQYFGHLMRRADSLEKTLKLGKIEGSRRRGRQRMRRCDDINNSKDTSLGQLWELTMDSEAWHVVVHGVTKNWTQLSNRTKLYWIFHRVYVPQLLYPFICKWKSRLLPCSTYCKQCGNEQWDMCVSFSLGFLRVYICLGVVLLGHMVILFLVFKGISIPSSIVAVSIHIPTNNIREFPFLHTLSSIYCL